MITIIIINSTKPIEDEDIFEDISSSVVNEEISFAYFARPIHLY